jgi:hypothetical protein
MENQANLRIIEHLYQMSLKVEMLEIFSQLEVF